MREDEVKRVSRLPRDFPRPILQKCSMAKAQQHEPQYVTVDLFSDIETEHLHQQIALLYVLLAETLEPPLHD